MSEVKKCVKNLMTMMYSTRYLITLVLFVNKNFHVRSNLSYYPISKSNMAEPYWLKCWRWFTWYVISGLQNISKMWRCSIYFFYFNTIAPITINVMFCHWWLRSILCRGGKVPLNHCLRLDWGFKTTVQYVTCTLIKKNKTDEHEVFFFLFYFD